MSKGVYITGISYKKLWVLLIDRDIKKSLFRKELNLSSGTWTKLNTSSSRTSLRPIRWAMWISSALPCGTNTVVWTTSRRCAHSSIPCTPAGAWESRSADFWLLGTANRLWQRYNNKSQQKPSQPTLKRHFLYQQKGRFFHGSTGKGVVSIKN